MGAPRLPVLVLADPAAYVARLRAFMQRRSVFVPAAGGWARLSLVAVDGDGVSAVGLSFSGRLVRWPRTADGFVLDPGIVQWPLDPPSWSLG
jgi:hypothetical protein